MKLNNYRFLIFYIGLCSIFILIKIDRECIKQEYTYVIETNGDDCPCEFEVWRAEISSPTNFESGDDDMIIDEDSWKIIHRQNDCYK